MLVKKLKETFEQYDGQSVTLQGWVRTNRNSKAVGFIALNDGTTFSNVQVVYADSLENFDEVSKITTGSAMEVTGKLVCTPEAKQPFEIQAENISVLGLCDHDYPLQKKRHSFEFMREIPHVRPRANTYYAMFRLRSVLSMAIHTFFQDRGFVYVHTPEITGNDAEGAGECFTVTTREDAKYDKDFFGKHAQLTVSGQLHVEPFALAYRNVYTFGPTFRAENSNTKIHASEFWMIEPEVAFCNLDGIMDIEEECLKFIVSYVLDKCPDEIEFLDKFVEKGLKNKLEKLVQSEFVRVTHEEVIRILKEASIDFEFTPEYGEDIAKEHEKYITEYFGCPVFIKDWPRDIKAFYMKQNDDGKTVRAVDLEVPGVGELIGGSEREADYDKLVNRMNELGMNIEELDWYVNLRKFGTVPHSGFGIGFERLLIYLTGVDNIRDVIPYPRTPKSCDF